MNTTTRQTLAVAAMLALLAGCGSAVTAETCDPGTSRDCACPGGGTGTQLCAADGSEWGACDCGGTDADADDTLSDTPEPDADSSLPETTGPDADADDVPDVPDVSPTPTNVVDLLLVIDNSPSMDGPQSVLMDAMPGFLAALAEQAAAAGLDLDLNVGVVSSDMGTYGYALMTCPNPNGGDDGCLQHEPRATGGCEPVYPTFLHRLDSESGGPTTSELAAAVACIGTLGTDGCGIEQPLRSLTRALTTQTAVGECNAGFLRTDSTVAVLVLSDENDCSVRPDRASLFDTSLSELGHIGVRCFLNQDYLVRVDEIVDALQGLETAGHGLFLKALVGVPPGVATCNGFGDSLDDCLDEPAMTETVDAVEETRLLTVCESPTARAVPGRRFVELAQGFGRRAHVSSICAADYTPALAAWAGTLF